MAASLLDRALNTLELMSTRPGGVSVTLIAEDIGLPKSGAHRLLADLIRLGYVRQDPETERYHLTTRLISIGLAYLSASGITDISQPILDRLAHESGELVRMAEENAKSGVFLTVLGFGIGNHNDAMLEQLSDKANGNYYFVDNESEARKVLVDQMTGTLTTIAKDVKIQVEFNPARVNAYRLIGYENRALRAGGFRDVREDAGELGGGGCVTVLYEIGVGEAPEPPDAELLCVKVRWKEPRGGASRRLDVPLRDRECGEPQGDFRFAAAVACWGMLLRDSEHRGEASYGLVRRLAAPVARDDYREEFLSLVKESRELAP